MQRLHRFFWPLVVVTVAVYGAMALWAGPNISTTNGRGLPFDMQMLGYSYDEARAYLGSLTPEGLAFYAGPAQWLDTFFPALFAMVLGIGCWILLAERPLILRLAALFVAGLYALFDYLENAAVARMLASTPDSLSEPLVETASRWTVLKFFFVDAAITILIVLMIARFVSRLRQQAE